MSTYQNYEIAPLRGAPASNTRVNVLNGTKNKTDYVSFKSSMTKMNKLYAEKEQPVQKLTKEQKVEAVVFANTFIKKFANGDLEKFYRTNFAKSAVENPRLFIARLYRDFVIRGFYSIDQVNSVLSGFVRAGRKLETVEVSAVINELPILEMF